MSGPQERRTQKKSPTPQREAQLKRFRVLASLMGREKELASRISRNGNVGERNRLVEELNKLRTAREALRTELMKEHGGLVFRVVYSEFGHRDDREDCIQDGFLGLARGLERFDPNRGSAPSTYLSSWIRKEIRAGIRRRDQPRGVRVPPYRLKQLGELKIAKQEIQQERGRKATIEELAKRLRIAPRTVERLRTSKLWAKSLSEEVDIYSSSPRHREDMLAQDTFGDPEEKVALRDLQRVVHAALARLPPRQRATVALCFFDPSELYKLGVGLSREKIAQALQRGAVRNGKGLTLKDAGRVLGCSRQAAHQLQEKAFRRLKAILFKYYRPGRIKPRLLRAMRNHSSP